MPEKLVLSCKQSPGDVVMLTAALRDLHLSYPNQFLTDVRTSYPDLWENNPFVTPLSSDDPGVTSISCRYPLINHANQAPFHFLQAYMLFIGRKLGLGFGPTEFRGDIHLSRREWNSMSPMQDRFGTEIPYWIIMSGGKTDYTTKWWDPNRYQEVVNHFRGRLLFVQVGRSEDPHPGLDGVVDLRGQTTLRELVMLIYHSQGVLCPVTCAMHLAAAVPIHRERRSARPCVVVAGGREPPHWEAYPGHQFIHTVGMLDCCATGGCWKTRVSPIGDGSKRDHPDSLCTHVVNNGLPKCMDIITTQDVCRRVEGYFEGEATRYLTQTECAILGEHGMWR